MRGHIVKVRLSRLLISNQMPRNLSIYTHLVRQDSHISTYGLTPKPLCTSLVHTKRPLVHSHNCGRWALQDPVARLCTDVVGKKAGIKGDGTRNTDNERTWEDNSPMISLIDEEGKVSSVSLFQAKKMAKRKDLKVVKVEDSSLSTKDKPVYKVLTGRQYYEEMKFRKNSKSSGSKFQAEKMLSLSAKIATHDLKLKFKNIQKWLSKGHQVRVTLISGGASQGDMDNVFATVENEMKSIKCSILQRQEKLGRRKFLIDPPKEMIVNREESETQDDQVHHAPSEGTHDKNHKTINEG